MEWQPLKYFKTTIFSSFHKCKQMSNIHNLQTEVSVPLMAEQENEEANLSHSVPRRNDSTASSFDRELNEETYTENSRYQETKMKIGKFYEDYIESNSGIVLLLTSQFLNSVMVTTCKLLVTDENFKDPIHPLQILFVRMFITSICCGVYMIVTKSVKDAPLGPKDLRGLLALRGFVGFLGVFGLYYSLQYLSLSDAVAITFLIPMITAFMAWIILGERYSFLEAFCALLSLGGVLLIAKPKFLFGTRSDSETSVDEGIESSSSELRLIASGVGLIGVMGASTVYVVLRKIGKSAHPLLSVSYYAATSSIISFFALLFIPSLSFVLPRNGYQWFLFMTIGFSGFLMQFALTAGIQRVKAGKSSLMIYTNMVFAVFWDLSIWGHFPGLLSCLGIILIIGNAYMVIKYKKNEDDKPSDIENQEIDTEVEDSSANEAISLQDFTITDESEIEHDHKDKR